MILDDTLISKITSRKRFILKICRLIGELSLKVRNDVFPSSIIMGRQLSHMFACTLTGVSNNQLYEKVK